jgi:excisionase family DNA binding protein
MLDTQVGGTRLTHDPAPFSAKDAAFLSVDEAPALLRVDRKTIHSEIAAGRLPHIRVGRVIRIPRAVLVLPRKSA